MNVKGFRLEIRVLSAWGSAPFGSRPGRAPRPVGSQRLWKLASRRPCVSAPGAASGAARVACGYGNDAAAASSEAFSPGRKGKHEPRSAPRARRGFFPPRSAVTRLTAPSVSSRAAAKPPERRTDGAVRRLQKRLQRLTAEEARAAHPARRENSLSSDSLGARGGHAGLGVSGGSARKNRPSRPEAGEQEAPVAGFVPHVVGKRARCVTSAARSVSRPAPVRPSCDRSTRVSHSPPCGPQAPGVCGRSRGPGVVGQSAEPRGASSRGRA